MIYSTAGLPPCAGQAPPPPGQADRGANVNGRTGSRLLLLALASTKTSLRRQRRPPLCIGRDRDRPRPPRQSAGWEATVTTYAASLSRGCGKEETKKRSKARHGPSATTTVWQRWSLVTESDRKCVALFYSNKASFSKRTFKRLAQRVFGPTYWSFVKHTVKRSTVEGDRLPP